MGDFFNMDSDWNWDTAGSSDSKEVSLRGAPIDKKIRKQRAKIQFMGQWMAEVYRKMQEELDILDKLEQGIADQSDTSVLRLPPPQGKVSNWLKTEGKENDAIQRMGEYNFFVCIQGISTGNHLEYNKSQK